MNVTQIPFAKHIGISKNSKGQLVLAPRHELENHIKSIHASAQFTLAETKSGDFMQEAFPEYVGKVVGLLRDVSVKYKGPAISRLTAYAHIEEESKIKFVTQLENKGRAGLTVHVELKDEENNMTMIGEFHWFVQKLD